MASLTDYKRGPTRKRVSLNDGFPSRSYGAAGPAVSLVTGTVYAPPPKRRLRYEPPPEHHMDLRARSLKITAMIEPAGFAEISPAASKTTHLRISAPPGQTVTAEIATKSLRKAIAAVTEHGPDGVALLLQGKLEGTVIVECGLVSMPLPKKTSQEAA